MHKLHLVAVRVLSSCGSISGNVLDEYDTSKLGNYFADNSNEAYDIGANKDGMPVFKDPNKAFKQALIDNKDGFAAIQEDLIKRQLANKKENYFQNNPLYIIQYYRS